MHISMHYGDLKVIEGDEIRFQTKSASINALLIIYLL